MNGNKSMMATGKRSISINDESYDISLKINDIQLYIKKITGFGLKLRYYEKNDKIDDVVKVTEELNDYKRDFIIQALVNAGMEKDKASSVIGYGIVTVLQKLEEWLGMTTKEKNDEFTKLDKKAKNL